MLPELVYTSGTVCHDNAVGNAPEVIPLDTSLFNDLDGGVERHVMCDSYFIHGDPRKFSFSVPSQDSSAFRRTLKGHPSSSRIKQDISKLVRSMTSIADAKGCIVHVLGNSGKRHDSHGNKYSDWKGKR